jgi:hypothetical protein
MPVVDREPCHGVLRAREYVTELFPARRESGRICLKCHLTREHRSCGGVPTAPLADWPGPYQTGDAHNAATGDPAELSTSSGAEEAAALARSGSTQRKIKGSVADHLLRELDAIADPSAIGLAADRLKRTAWRFFVARCWRGAKLTRRNSCNHQVSFPGADRPNHVTG